MTELIIKLFLTLSLFKGNSAIKHNPIMKAKNRYTFTVLLPPANMFIME